MPRGLNQEADAHAHRITLLKDVFRGKRHPRPSQEAFEATTNKQESRNRRVERRLKLLLSAFKERAQEIIEEPEADVTVLSEYKAQKEAETRAEATGANENPTIEYYLEGIEGPVGVRHAEKKDAETIARIYSEGVCMTRDKLFDPERNFSKTGGIFYQLSSSELEALIEDRDGHKVTVVTVLDENGDEKVVGSLTSQNYNDYSELPLDESQFSDTGLRKFRKAEKRGGISNSLDIIIDPEYQGLGLSAVLRRYAAIKEMADNRDFDQLEIFFLKSVTMTPVDADGNRIGQPETIELNMPNQLSIDVHRSMGARQVSSVERGIKSFIEDGVLYEVDVLAQVFAMNNNTCADACSKMISRREKPDFV